MMNYNSQGCTWEAITGLIAALIIALGGVSVIDDVGASEPAKDATDSAQASGSTSIDRAAVQDEPGPVVIIVVDDFGYHLAPIVNGIDMYDTANQIREEINRDALAEPDSDEGQQALADLNNIISGAFQDTFEQAEQLAEEHIEGEVEENNCAVIPEGQAFQAGGADFQAGGADFQAGGAGSPGSPGGVHGVRVYRQLEQLMQKYEGDGYNISLTHVDTQGFTTEVIINRLQEKITQIREESPETHIVINMSFALIPCDQVATFAQYGSLMQKFDAEAEEDYAYLAAVFKHLVTGEVFDADLVSDDAIETYCPEIVDGDLRCVAEGEGVVVGVGAAGNEGDEFPYFPAAFDWVTSVSASYEEVDFIATQDRAEYSNFGAVLMPGNWVDPLTNRTEVGTSFGAPRYSFAMALWLAGADVAVVGCTSVSDIPAPVLPDSWDPNAPANPNQPLC